MYIETIINLRKAARELRANAEYGKRQAARPDADSICRLGDEAIVQYEETADAIDRLVETFPNYEEMSRNPFFFPTICKTEHPLHWHHHQPQCLG